VGAALDEGGDMADDVVFRSHHLTKKYKSTTALDSVSMQIERGQIYGFVGQNGAGKSTLVRLLAGVAQPTSGSIELFGERDPRSLARMRRRTGGIIESPVIFPDLTARQNLEVLRIQRGLPGKRRVDEALEVLGLENTGRKRAKDFSLGMRQRMAVAVALLGNPEFLILDEPTNGLDPMWTVRIRELLAKLNREHDVTILISSHILGELHKLATHYGFIHRGTMLEEISAAELDSRCRSYLRIVTDDASRAATLLENELGLHDYHVASDDEVHVHGMAHAPELIASALVHGGVQLKAIFPDGDDLETYFSKLVTKVDIREPVEV
jgi:ABC-2 type transport system ATP-binding protein